MSSPVTAYKLTKYRRSPIVEARVITTATSYDTPEGRLVGMPGDYELTDPRGFPYPVKKWLFERSHTPVPEDATEGAPDPTPTPEE